MSVEFDFSDLHKLSADFGTSATASPTLLRAAVQVTSQHVKDAWNQKLAAGAGPHTPRVGRAITYDTEIKSGEISSEIGAVRGSGRQAGIVRLLENGSVHNGGRGYGAAALHENENDFETGIQKATDAALKAAGL